jgi:hypothetical protein
MKTDPTTTTAPAPTPCPVCGALRDLAGRISGDTISCPDCGAWLRVMFQDGGGSSLTISEPPATWPKERRTKERP